MKPFSISLWVTGFKLSILKRLSWFKLSTHHGAPTQSVCVADCYFIVNVLDQGRSQDFSKGGSQTGTPSGDRRLYMVYTAALPRVPAGLVVLSQHEGPY